MPHVLRQINKQRVFPNPFQLRNAVFYLNSELCLIVVSPENVRLLVSAVVVCYVMTR